MGAKLNTAELLLLGSTPAPAAKKSSSLPGGGKRVARKCPGCGNLFMAHNRLIRFCRRCCA